MSEMSGSYADRVRQAANIQEAMLTIAEGIDAVLAAPARSSASEWGQWGGAPAADSQPAAAPSPDWYAKTVPAGEKDPRFGILEHSGELPGEPGDLEIDEATGMIDLPAASPERQALRRKLAEAIDLPGYFSPMWRTGEPAQQLIDSYAKGGPQWLYHNRHLDDGHDIFEALSPEAKRLMILDIKEDSERAAWEFQRDVMKGHDAEGSTLSIAQDNIDGVINGPRIGLKS